MIAIFFFCKKYTCIFHKGKHAHYFIKLLKKDKKSTKGKIVYILPTGKKGVSLIETDDEQKIKKLIHEYIKQAVAIKI